MSAVILDPIAVHAKIGFTVRTLANWRAKKIGPKSFRLGSSVRYYESDVDQWVEDQATKSSSR